VGLEGDLGLQVALVIAVEVDLEDTAGFGAAEARPVNDAATSRPIAMATSNGLLLRIASIGSPLGPDEQRDGCSGRRSASARFALQRAIDLDFVAAGSPRRQRFCDGDGEDGSGGPPWPLPPTLGGGPPCPPLSEGSGCLRSLGSLAFCFPAWSASQ
jgi:hypothetical protein